MEHKSDRFNLLLSTLAGPIPAALFRYISFNSPDGALGIHTLGNIKAYFIFALLWVGTFFLADTLLRRFNNRQPRLISKILITAPFVVILAILYYKIYRHLVYGTTIKYIIVSTIFTTGLTAYAVFVRHDHFRKVKAILLWALTLLMSGLWFLTSSTVNTFSHYSFGRSYNIYHSSAYIDSIINTYYGAPFTGIESELYGHYSILMYLPMKIFGMNTYTIGIIMGILTAAAFIFLAASMMMTIKPFFLKCFSIGGLGLYGLTAYSIYWQSFPHRMFFPALIIFLITLLTYKKIFRRSFFFIGLSITTMALIWNTETGAVCVVTWGVYGGFCLLKDKKLLSTFLSVIISAASSLAGSLMILNIYNLTHGGSAMGIKELIGFQGQGFVDTISKELDTGNALYVHIFIVLFLCATLGIHSVYIQKELEPKGALFLALGVMGLGIGTYYVNNPSGGTGILSMYFVVGIALLLSMAKFKVINAMLALYAALCLFYCGIEGKFLISQLKSMHDAGAYDYKPFEDFCEDLDTRIAPDTKGAGYGTAAVFMELGRDRGGRDFHFNMEEIEGCEHFIKFCDGNDEFEGYEIIDVIPYEETAFNYYEKIS